MTIERWVTSLSNSQQEQLEDLQKQADRNNATAKNSFESLKQKLRTFLPDTSCLIEQKNVMSDFTQNSDIGGGLKEAINSDIEKLILQLNKLLDKIKSLNFEIDSWNISTPFNIKNTLKTIFQDVDNLSINLESFQETSSALRSLQSNIRDLTEGTKGCLNTFKAYFNNLRDTITLLKFQQSNYTASKEIGDEVKTFTLDNLPEKGFINLKGTGSRNNGDELEVEVLLRIPSQTKGIPETRYTLESRTFYMQLIGARSEIAVGMILANPWNFEGQDTGLEREFFYAPTASLLLKFGSKSSYFYNEFIDLGIGLNFASPDFDTDGTPEFGTGIIVTGFKNILSFGINYNVTLDEPYWFFGVNLPFTIPGVPVNAIKD